MPPPRVACLVARELGAASVVVAMPVGAPDSLAELAAMPEVDEVVCLSAPPGFMAVGMHYLDFRQTADAEVQAILEASRPAGPTAAPTLRRSRRPAPGD